MSNIVTLPVVTRLDLPPERIIEAAASAGLKDVIVIGLTDDDDFYFAGNMADGGKALWLLELAKLKLFEVAE